jgi:hypothetical protein
MELTHDEIESLYSEASVRAYRPEAVLCELGDGSRVPALCFNLLKKPTQSTQRSCVTWQADWSFHRITSRVFNKIV